MVESHQWSLISPICNLSIGGWCSYELSGKSFRDHIEYSKNNTNLFNFFIQTTGMMSHYRLKNNACIRKNEACAWNQVCVTPNPNTLCVFMWEGREG